VKLTLLFAYQNPPVSRVNLRLKRFPLRNPLNQHLWRLLRLPSAGGSISNASPYLLTRRQRLRTKAMPHHFLRLLLIFRLRMIPR
jgi:hypothetical protein